MANRLNNLALLYRDERDYALALPLFKRALSIRKTTLGQNHPLIANTLNNLAGPYQAENKTEQAVELYKQSSAIQEENIGVMMLQSSGARRLQYINSLSEITSAIVSINIQDGLDNSAATQLALSTILQRQGRVLDAVANTSQQVRSQLSPENKALLDELNSARSAISNLRFNSASGLSTAQYLADLAQLEAKAEQLEETLTRSSAEYAIETKPVSIASVQSAIPADSALVEFVRYQPLDLNHLDQPWQPARYAAYVLTQQGDAQPIDLGEADQLAAQFQSALSSRSTNVKALGRQLDERLMAPLRPALSNKTHLLLSPDSQLTLIPFEALVNENDQYLIEDYQTSYLTSGRDLLKLSLNPPSSGQSVIIANPNYEKSAASTATGNNSRSVDAASLRFGPLPGTDEEAKAIAPLLPNVNLYTQNEATESVLKECIPVLQDSV